jgi:hypothetical protein
LLAAQAMFEYVDDRVDKLQIGLIPASMMTRRHFSISADSICPSSSGVVGSGSPPSLVIAATTASDPSASFKPEFSRSMI